MRIGFLVSHPIQYYAPIFRALASRCDLTVFFAHRQTAEQQARAGFGVAFDWDVDILSGYDSRFLVNRAQRPSTDTFWGCHTPDVAGEIAGGKFDAFVVPGWALRSYWQTVVACRRSGVPVMARGDSQLAAPRRSGWRAPAIRLAKAMLFPGMLKMFDGFLFPGQRNRQYLLHHGVPADRLFFSPHCVDNDAFRTGSAEARARHLRDRAAGAPARRVLFAGKLIGRKHPQDLVRAATLLKQRAAPVELVFAGSGELQPSLEQEAVQSGVQARFLGFVNQSGLPGVYASADALVLPSDATETWGLVVNEAMACGLPAVVSDRVGCGPDLIEPGQTGDIFAHGDVAGLAQSIDRVLAFDPTTASQQIASRIARYSPERTAEGVLEGADRLCRDRLVM